MSTTFLPAIRNSGETGSTTETRRPKTHHRTRLQTKSFAHCEAQSQLNIRMRYPRTQHDSRGSRCEWTTVWSGKMNMRWTTVSCCICAPDGARHGRTRMGAFYSTTLAIKPYCSTPLAEHKTILDDRISTSNIEDGSPQNSP